MVKAQKICSKQDNYESREKNSQKEMSFQRAFILVANLLTAMLVVYE